MASHGNKQVLCCLKIKSAALLIGTIDLVLHMSLLATLFASFTHPDIFDHYYVSSISLISSSASSCSTSKYGMDPSSSMGLASTPPLALPSADETDSYNKNIFIPLPSDSSSPPHSDIPKDNSVVLLITAFSAFIIFMLVYGILKNRPSYLMPYFSIKVFQVVMSCLTTLGFYSCLPDVRVWVRNHQYFPLKSTILLFDNHTLELLVFSILLATILVKLYVCIIVWYCYRYMIAMQSITGCLNGVGTTSSMGGSSRCRSAMIVTSTHDPHNNGINFDEMNSEFKIEDDEYSSSNLPPKYEEVVKTTTSAAQIIDQIPMCSVQVSSSAATTSSQVADASASTLPAYSSLKTDETHIV